MVPIDHERIHWKAINFQNFPSILLFLDHFMICMMTLTLWNLKTACVLLRLPIEIGMPERLKLKLRGNEYKEIYLTNVHFLNFLFLVSTVWSTRQTSDRIVKLVYYMNTELTVCTHVASVLVYVSL